MSKPSSIATADPSRVFEEETDGCEHVISQKQNEEQKPEHLLFEQLLEVEAECCKANDYRALHGEYPSTLNYVWRETVTQWCYDVTDHMGEPRSVVYMAMNILDRFCAVLYERLPGSLTERTYEFASMTALFLAIRIVGSGDLKISDLIQMSRDTVQVDDIVSTGKQMMNLLTWQHRLITPQDFLTTSMKLLPQSVEEPMKLDLLDAASYLVELAVCDLFLSKFPASKIAYAALLNATHREGILSESETAAFFEQIEKMSPLDRHSEETGILRARIHCVSSRVEHIEEAAAPHYISDDEDDDDDYNSTKYMNNQNISRKRRFSQFR